MTTEQLTAAIAADYQAGAKMENLRRDYAIGYAAIYWHLGRANLPLRGLSGPSPTCDRDKLHADLRAGIKSARLLAEEHGISRERVYQISYRLGTTFRRKRK